MIGAKNRITPQLIQSYAEEDKTFKLKRGRKPKTKTKNIFGFALDKDNNEIEFEPKLAFNNTDEFDPKYYKKRIYMPKKGSAPQEDPPQDGDRFENYLLVDLKKLIRNYKQHHTIKVSKKTKQQLIDELKEKFIVRNHILYMIVGGSPEPIQIKEKKPRAPKKPREKKPKAPKRPKGPKTHDWESSASVARQKARNDKNRKENDWGEEAEWDENMDMNKEKKVRVGAHPVKNVPRQPPPPPPSQPVVDLAIYEDPLNYKNYNEDGVIDPDHPELFHPINDNTPFPRILSKYKNPNQVLVNNGIPIQVEDLSRLKSPNWLNDAIISDYFRILSNTEEAKNQNYFFMDVNSLGFLLEKKNKIKPSTFNYFKYDTLYLPLNLGNLHWILLIIKPMDLRVFYLDSLFGRDDTSKVDDITSALTHYAKLFKVNLPGKIWGINYATKSEIVAQDNGYDCGVFVCLYAYRDLNGEELKWNLGGSKAEKSAKIKAYCLGFRSKIANSILQNKMLDA